MDEGKNKGCWVMAASHFRDDTTGEEGDDDAKAVSYTHLTLPTSDLV